MISGDLAFLHGRNPFDFMLGSMEAYLRPYDDSQPWQHVGNIEPEVTFSPTIEYAEWKSGVPGVLYIKRAISADYAVTFSFKQVGDLTVLGLALNLENDYSDADTDVGYFGSNPPAPLECRWRWIGQLVDGRPIQVVFRRAIIANPEDLVFGGGEYTNIPVNVQAMKDDQVCDGQQDMGFVCVGKLSVPSGGFQDPCAAEVEPVCVIGGEVA